MNKTIQEQLELSSGVKLKLKINDNYSTMLSVRWEPDHARVSLHRMFLEAPKNVMDDLACYIKGKSKGLPCTIKAFIERKLPSLDYSHTVSDKDIETRGQIYDLKVIYDEINTEYFKQDLNLFITWYGQVNKRYRSQINFGLYSDPLRLIKIHRILDDNDVPPYVIHFIVYHEMLHNVCPPEPNNEGNNIIHTSEFKEREKQFIHYQQAEDWIKMNKERFFS